MAGIYRFHGYPIMVTRRANAVSLKLRYVPGREWFDLTVPPGCGSGTVDRFLTESLDWLKKMSGEHLRQWTPRMAAGERAWLAGRLVTLGRDGIPAGQDFLKLRDRMLADTVRRLLALWCPRMKVTVSHVTLRDMSSKWGSCRYDVHRITLNERLGAMPERLTEYVLVHELTHLHHPDHSPAFHAQMTALMPDWPRRKDELNHFGELFLPPEDEKQ